MRKTAGTPPTGYSPSPFYTFHPFPISGQGTPYKMSDRPLVDFSTTGAEYDFELLTFIGYLDEEGNFHVVGAIRWEVLTAGVDVPKGQEKYGGYRIYKYPRPTLVGHGSIKIAQEAMDRYNREFESKYRVIDECIK